MPGNARVRLREGNEGAFQVNAAPNVPAPRRSWKGAVETNVQRSYRARKDNRVRPVGVFRRLGNVRHLGVETRCAGAMAKHTGIGAFWNAHPARQNWPKARASFSVTASPTVASVRLVCPFHPLRSLQTERPVARILRARCIRTCREIDVCSVGEPECRTGLGVNSMNQDRNGRNFSCYPTTRRAGICLSECDPSADNACGPYTCATVDAWGAEAPVQSSVCLVGCEVDADCPGQLQCRPDYRGVQVCQSCVCSSFESEPYCIQGTRFSNACELLCSGRRLQEGRLL